MPRINLIPWREAERKRKRQEFGVGALGALVAAGAIAFLVNLLAYPFVLGLLPYIAKEVFAAGQSGLGYLAASFWLGGLAGSLLVGSARLPLRSGRVMLWCGGLWFGALLAFGQTTTFGLGLALLFATGFVQSFCLTPLAAVMLRSSEDAMRGRVMGVRMLAVYGLPLGLIGAGFLIERIGYPLTITASASLGLLCTVLIGMRWRASMWRRAPAPAPTA